MSLGVIKSEIQTNLYSVKFPGINDEVILWCCTADALTVGSKVAIADVDNWPPSSKSKILPNTGVYIYEDKRLWYNPESMREAKHNLAKAMIFFNRWQIECPEYTTDQITSIIDDRYVTLRDRPGDIRVDYMDCDALAFAEDDFVLVKFEYSDRNRPVVVGFVEDPQACAKYLIMIVSDEMGISGIDYGIVWNTKSDKMHKVYKDGVELQQPALLSDLQTALSRMNFVEMTFPEGEASIPNLQTGGWNSTNHRMLWWPGDKPAWVEYLLGYPGGPPNLDDWNFYAPEPGGYQGPIDTCWWSDDIINPSGSCLPHHYPGNCLIIHIGEPAECFSDRVRSCTPSFTSECYWDCECISYEVILLRSAYTEIGQGTRARSVSKFSLPNNPDDFRYSYVRFVPNMLNYYYLHHDEHPTGDPPGWPLREIHNEQITANFDAYVHRWDGSEPEHVLSNFALRTPSGPSGYERYDAYYTEESYPAVAYYLEDFKDVLRPKDIYFERGWLSIWSGVGCDYVMNMDVSENCIFLIGKIRVNTLFERNYYNRLEVPITVTEDSTQLAYHKVDVWVQLDTAPIDPDNLELGYNFSWGGFVRVGLSINDYIASDWNQNLRVFRPQLGE